jgi:N-acylethanolamine-hydrolysing acid amidase
MHHANLLIAGPWAILCILPAAAVPAFNINLDLPPEKRWAAVAKHYRHAIVESVSDMIPEINSWTNRKDWIDNVQFDSEYEKELQGIVNVVNHPEINVQRLKWLNMEYEMDSPRSKGCSDVLWAKPDGTVVHGRNLDWRHGKWGAFPQSTMDFSAILFEATFHKGGKKLMKANVFPGEIGVHTGMRFPTNGVGGWAFAQNTRTPNDKWKNWDAASAGGQIFPLGVRRIMEKTSDFQTAAQRLYQTKWAAPHYFTVSGGGKMEGGVLTIDRLGAHSPGTPPIQHLGGKGNEWSMVQTNDDLLSPAKDDRRPLATRLLQGVSRESTKDEGNMMRFMHTTKLLNDDTIFSTVMVPATGYFKTALPNEAPAKRDGAMISGGFALNQNNRFLAPVSDLLQRTSKTIAAHEMAADEVSLMQVSLNLDL